MLYRWAMNASIVAEPHPHENHAPMSNLYPARLSLPDLGARTSEAAIDYALTLLMADEIEPSLRWGAAALECHPLMPAALLVTARGLEQMGRARAAVEGLRMAAVQAAHAGDLPLAVAALDDLRLMGSPVDELVAWVAASFARGSPPLRETPGVSPPQYHGFFQPLSPFLAGPPLASKATQILQAARRAAAAAANEGLALAPLPFFSSLSEDSLRRLILALRVVTVPAGQLLIQEGEPSSSVYIVARGEVEIARSATREENRPSLALARLGAGAFFGELSLLSGVASGTSVTSTRPSILLVGDRNVLLALAAEAPELSVQLAAHCRRHALANLGRASPLVAALAEPERATLVERLEMRVYETGERVARDGMEADGLHLIMSGEVAIVTREGAERLVLAILNLGETIGEFELVLCQRRYADAVATRPTATLFLSRNEYHGLVQDHPRILHSLYAMALRRHTESRLALAAGSASVIADDELPFVAVEEDEPTLHRFPQPAVPSSVPPPRPAIHPPSTNAGRPSIPVPQGPPASLLPASATLPPSSGRDSTTVRRGSPPWLAGIGAVVGAGVASLVALVALGGRPASPAQGASVSPPATSPSLQAPPAVAPPQAPLPAPPPTREITEEQPRAVMVPSAVAVHGAVGAAPVQRLRAAGANARPAGTPPSPAAMVPTPAQNSARDPGRLASDAATAGGARPAGRPGAPAPAADDFGGRE